MTVSRAEQKRRDDQKREVIVSRLFAKISWKDYLDAAEFEITEAMVMAGQEFPTSIMLAHVKDPEKSIEELAGMGLVDLNRIIFGDLMPEELEVLGDDE